MVEAQDEGVSNQDGLPFVDEHSVAVNAPAERTWAALQQYVDRLVSSRHSILFRVLGTHPRSGFAVHSKDPGREVRLAGRHRFSTYQLVFTVNEVGPRSQLTAVTYAAFPGVHGRAYRRMLMVTTGHVRATNRMLRSVARRAEA